MANGNILMKITGKQQGWIKGEAGYKGHEGWIDIESVGQSASSSGSFGAGTGGGHAAVVFHDLQISKMMDRSSVLLLKALDTNEHIPEVIIEKRKGTGDKALAYLTIKLTNARITSFNLNGHSGAMGSESLALNYEKAEFTYSQQDEAGNKKGGDVVTMVDLVGRH